MSGKTGQRTAGEPGRHTQHDRKAWHPWTPSPGRRRARQSAFYGSENIEPGPENTTHSKERPQTGLPDYRTGADAQTDTGQPGRNGRQPASPTNDGNPVQETARRADAGAFRTPPRSPLALPVGLGRHAETPPAQREQGPAHGEARHTPHHSSRPDLRASEMLSHGCPVVTPRTGMGVPAWAPCSPSDRGPGAPLPQVDTPTHQGQTDERALAAPRP